MSGSRVNGPPGERGLRRRRGGSRSMPRRRSHGRIFRRIRRTSISSQFSGAPHRGPVAHIAAAVTAYSAPYTHAALVEYRNGSSRSYAR